VQAIPHLGEWAKELTVFQRTPSSIDVRNNTPTDPAWAASLEPGWQQRRMDNFNTLVSGGFEPEDLVKDGWTDIIRNLGAAVGARMATSGGIDRAELGRLMELSDFKKMNQVRARVDATVKDPATAEKLKPWYRQFCKRPTFNDDYLPTFNRPNVTLVDTLGRGVDRIDETGLWFDGVHYEVDCIIFATGFEVGTAYTRRAGFEVYGKDGRTLTERWAGGLKTLHGFYTDGFPNCFHLGITQNTLTPNFPHMLDEQADYVAEVVRKANLRQARVVEPTPEAESGWVQTIKDNALANIKFRSDCTPGYYNGEGRAGEGNGLFDGLYGPGSDAFFALVRRWREEQDMAGVNFA
jgi:cation diffusion facilitator CzcD-associated flavoprotein CzcO